MGRTSRERNERNRLSPGKGHTQQDRPHGLHIPQNIGQIPAGIGKAVLVGVLLGRCVDDVGILFDVTTRPTITERM